MENSTAPIYFDYNATTPVDPEVFAAMEPYFKQHFGNPASAGHTWGWAAEAAVVKGREQVAQLIGAKSQEVIFTSGATESNNWAIFGLLSKLRENNPQEPVHFITSNVEHSSIMKGMAALTRWNVDVTFLPVDHNGQVQVEQVKKALRPHTRMMSFIWVNNEIGTINPIAELAALAKENKIYFHTDATQAAGKIPMNVTDMGIDLMSFSAHKIYGPKGVGALYIRGKDPKVQLDPLIYGGGQERGLRSGTVNVPGVVGFGKAAELCKKNQAQESAKLRELSQTLWKELQAAIPGVKLNGHPTERAANNLNITLPGAKTEKLMSHLQKLGVSTGSACGTGAMVISHVLTGIGLSPEEVQCSLRLSLGRWTTREEISRAVDILKEGISK
ncbi:aminotransferase [Bdellovibrio bacteriovorus]|uniref:cysteine desulfurase n=1 Tax=Bdellovibrio bacteriovorus TaxID=959 RepID=A0A150WF42_BDEBC|nr:cysteine desulfurase family protein [Bdellovibrio bacteriovorus]KYG61636.1 aminotransferase [Bdellovibrio bacteriovorus]